MLASESVYEGRRVQTIFYFTFWFSFLSQHFKFRVPSAPGVQPVRAVGCAATRKAPEGAANRAPWTRPLQVQVLGLRICTTSFLPHPVLSELTTCMLHPDFIFKSLAVTLSYSGNKSWFIILKGFKENCLPKNVKVPWNGSQKQKIFAHCGFFLIVPGRRTFLFEWSWCSPNVAGMFSHNQEA